ncbi:MAG: chorismate synthase [Muribaculaceae bacterium]|nr:chorismate synthase [Muribaculaceae bacterium]
MGSNSFGKVLTLTTFGESHGKCMGGVIDGFPAGIKIDFARVESEMAKRRPGGEGVSRRNEKDEVEFLSGITDDGISLGTPIGFIVRNIDTRSKDYSEVAEKYRPNHADYTTEKRYGIRDYRGGGRASARETVSRLVGGALALQYLESNGITIETAIYRIGVSGLYPSLSERLRIAEEIRGEHDSVGAIVECRIKGVMPGIGNPVYDKLSSNLAAAMLSINAVMGFEYGEGFHSSEMRGSQMADEFYISHDADRGDRVRTGSNHCGGIQGGISNGEEIYFRVAFKPTPTIARELRTVAKNNEETVIKVEGRHDPCVGLRGEHVVRSMAALVLADNLLLYRGICGACKK